MASAAASSTPSHHVDPRPESFQIAAAADGHTWQVREADGAEWARGFHVTSAQNIKNLIVDSMSPTAMRTGWLAIQASSDDSQERKAQVKWMHDNCNAAPLSPYQAVWAHALGSGKQKPKPKWHEPNVTDYPLIPAINDAAMLSFCGLDCSAMDELVPDLKFGIVSLNHDFRLRVFLSDHNRIMLIVGAFKSDHSDSREVGYEAPPEMWNEHNKSLFVWA